MRGQQTGQDGSGSRDGRDKWDWIEQQLRVMEARERRTKALMHGAWILAALLFAVGGLALGGCFR